ncbi:MAG: DNA-processing protein DprA [Chloroflexi bacterium]|nr:DNA-processing protein DprA [Chloroflexota bacterium]
MSLIELRRADAGYPSGLADLPRPPDPLWIEGDLAVFDHVPRIAIVGTRRLTGYGERVARELATAVATGGAVVVSGLAQGIDSAAHSGALDAGAPTVAVLGEGIGSFHATAGRRRAQLAQRCVLVSPYPPDAPALPWMFAKRNAIIAALAALVVVVEAPPDSGALITAGDARRLGRPLFAVPGPLGSAASVGTNALIADGLARAVTGADTLLVALGLAAATAPSTPPSLLADALAAGPLAPDALAELLGLSAASVAASCVADPRLVTLPDGRISLR